MANCNQGCSVINSVKALLLNDNTSVGVRYCVVPSFFGDCQSCASTFAPHTTTAGETGVDTIEKCICAGADPTSFDPNGFYQIAPDLMTTEMIKEDPAQRVTGFGWNKYSLF